MRILNLGDQQTASRYVAIELIKLLQDKPDAILGLATGASMTSVYPYFTDLLDLNHIDVSQVHTFNLDEYVGLDAHHEHSYHHYMHERLFDNYSGWNKAFIHIPNGAADNLESEALRYETLLQSVGQRDIQLLGIGQNGHIGFNEPGTPFDSHTRVVNLTTSTIQANSVHFSKLADVPKQAISMGLDNITRAKRIILLAFGDKKHDALQRLIDGHITEDLPASILHQHERVDVIVDNALYQSLNI